MPRLNGHDPLIPREITQEAMEFAENQVKEALHGLFGLVEHELERRRSYEFAVEKALFHKKMVILLSSDRGNGIVDREGKIRRHQRRELRWSAHAYARSPQLAEKCSLQPSLVESSEPPRPGTT